MALLCGHPEECMYRYRHKGLSHKYCLACIVEKHPDAQIGSEDYAIANKESYEKATGIKLKPSKKKVDANV